MKINFEKYDRFLLRGLGTFLLIGCIGVILFSAVTVFNIFNRVMGVGRTPDIVKIDQDSMKEDNLRLGDFRVLKGTDLVLLPLSADRTYGNSSDSRPTYGEIQNYLVFNSKTKENYWMWKSNSFLVLEYTEIHDQVGKDKGQRTSGLVFEVILNEPTTDGGLVDKRHRSIDYFDLSSKKFVSVVSKIDRSIMIQQTADDEVLFLYSRAGKSYFKTLALGSFTLSTEKDVGLPH